MNRISFAFRSFFSILFGGSLAQDIALAFGYTKPMPVRTTAASSPGAPTSASPFTAAEKKAPAPAAAPTVNTSDGAVQILSILQRDARLVDFVMEDISAYSDEQVGSAVRDVHAQTKVALERYLKLAPVIDGVEGDFTKVNGLGTAAVKFVGNVPPSGKAPGGLLRHKGWKADKIELPTAQTGSIVAPAEIEVE